MLKIKDANGKTKFVLRDEDEQPITIDEFLLVENKETKKEEVKEKEDGTRTND